MSEIVIPLSGSEQLVINEGLPKCGASISSSVRRGDDTPAFNGACDGVEALVLALHSAGVDFRAPAIQQAVRETFEKVAEELGEE